MIGGIAMERVRSAAILLCAGLALSACQTGRPGQPVTGPAEAEAVPPAAVPAPAPTTQVATQPPGDDDPHQLMGLNRDGLTAVLGAPTLVRREAPAEIWQYLAEGCVFDVVLYQKGADYAVSYLEARDAAAAVQEPRPCLNQLLRARQAAPVS
ncbi:MAG: hypothetical protein RLN99_17145 [Kiloniellaceae bacterium]